MIGIIESSLSIFYNQWKGLVHPLVLASHGNRSPFPVQPHNLNHVSVVPFTLRLFCLSLWRACAHLCSRPIAHTPSPTRGVVLSTYVIKSFAYISLYCHTDHFILSFQVFFTKDFFTSPPWVLSSTFHFSVSFTTLPPCRRPSANLLLCLLVVVVRRATALRNCQRQFYQCELNWRSCVACNLLVVRVERY